MKGASSFIRSVSIVEEEKRELPRRRERRPGVFVDDDGWRVLCVQHTGTSRSVPLPPCPYMVVIVSLSRCSMKVPSPATLDTS